MRVLIIEDNTFNAFCLSRLLESVSDSLTITVASNSYDALSSLNVNLPDLVIVDGELNRTDETSIHGPELANTILQIYPHLPLIAWSDSENMLKAFTKVFIQHNRLVNEYNIWNKTVNPENIQKTWAFYFNETIGKKQHTFSYLANKNHHSNYHLDCI